MGDRTLIKRLIRSAINCDSFVTLAHDNLDLPLLRRFYLNLLSLWNWWLLGLFLRNLLPDFRLFIGLFSTWNQSLLLHFEFNRLDLQ